jgi:mannose-1-phosphate guanylyltransferase/mannose-6-phosphate isomerase
MELPNDIIIPVVLCGGSGTRLWPLSRQDHPKQLLKLVNENTLLQETLLRLANIPHLAPPIIVCNQAHKFILVEQLNEIGIFDAVILLEPEGKNTAPAATIAALYLIQHYNNIDPLMLILPADHAIKNRMKFTAAILQAKRMAEQPYLITFGIKATRPETDYGYIKKGRSFNGDETYYIDEFVEKPNRLLAEKYLASDEYYWNSGMFMFHCSSYIEALKVYAPVILDVCTKALNLTANDINYLSIDPETFQHCPSKSIDYAIMEKSQNGVMVLLDADWSDLGSWEALWDAKNRDEGGNVQSGDIYTHDVKNSYLHSEHRMLAVMGITDHVVIETADAVFVTHKSYSHNIKSIVDKLKAQSRPELKMRRLVYRPWGFYEILEHSGNFQVKRLCINAYAKTSLQAHQHRSEHWIVVKGVAQVVRAEEEFELYLNQSTYIPAGIKHRLANDGPEELMIIEVQTGSYLGEDDIVRFDDEYSREVLN